MKKQDTTDDKGDIKEKEKTETEPVQQGISKRRIARRILGRFVGYFSRNVRGRFQGRRR